MVVTDPKDTANSYDEMLMGEDELFLPAREEYHHERAVETEPDASPTAQSATQRQQSRATADVGTRRFSTSAAAEFPPPPTTIEYETLGPYVELARVVRDSAGVDGTRARGDADADSRSPIDPRGAPGARGVVRVQAFAPPQVRQDVRGYRVR